MYGISSVSPCLFWMNLFTIELNYSTFFFSFFHINSKLLVSFILKYVFFFPCHTITENFISDDHKWSYFYHSIVNMGIMTKFLPASILYLSKHPRLCMMYHMIALYFFDKYMIALYLCSMFDYIGNCTPATWPLLPSSVLLKLRMNLVMSTRLLKLQKQREKNKKKVD